MGASPQLSLGGTGVIPIRDTEDAHVLETAIAGKADVLITANFKDFISKDTEVVIPGRHAVYRSPDDHAF
jgi:predicted nucleic acid-binding protein